MTLLRRVILSGFILLGTSAVEANFDTSHYDPEVTNYIMEIHERFNGQEISKKEFIVHYKKLVKAPTASRLKQVTLEMYTLAQKRGYFVKNYNFVKAMHALILGHNILSARSNRHLLSNEVDLLDTGKVSQEFLLKIYLETTEGKERMSEIVEGETIQQARFKDFKLSANF